MTNVVDAVIAEYANEPEKEITTPVQEKEPEPEIENPEPGKETEKDDAEQSDDATGKEDSKDEPFPKKAKNAISQLKQSNARKNAHIRHLQQKIAELNKTRSVSEPKEEDFSNWAEHQDARVKHLVKLETVEQQVADAKTRVEAYEQEEESARIAEVNEIGENFEREHPAAAKLIADNMAVIASLPTHVKKALQLADNPPLALHNLIADGKLEYLSQLPPERAAIEIGKADARAMQPKPQTKAPAPMQPARANVNPGFNWQSMSADELLKTIRKG